MVVTELLFANPQLFGAIESQSDDIRRRRSHVFILLTPIGIGEKQGRS